MTSNATLGMTVQSIICDRYHIIPCPEAQKQFDAVFDAKYVAPFERIIDSIFDEIGSYPVKFLTFTSSPDNSSALSPHNFLLKSGKTLSIRTNLNNDKVAP